MTIDQGNWLQWMLGQRSARALQGTDKGEGRGRKWEKLHAGELDQRFLGIKDKKEP